ncbi:MAG: hypothetical protein VX768_10045 [Planctomycetota bacterium]|nr:hypothetical protein [Planctomycetota bacterium]
MSRSAIFPVFLMVVFFSGQTLSSQTDVRRSKIRKIFVPQEDMQKLIQGKYLPLEIESLDEFLRQNRKTETPRLRYSGFDLTWTEEKGLYGTAQLIADREKPVDILIRSNLEFSSPKGSQTTVQPSFRAVTLDSNLLQLGERRSRELPFAVIGRNLEGSIRLSAIGDHAFISDIRLPESSNQQFNSLQLPDAEKRQVTVRVPNGFSLKTNHPTLKLASCPQLGDSYWNNYLVLSHDDEILFRVQRETETTVALPTSDQIVVEGTLAAWNCSFILPGNLAGTGSFQFETPSGFSCNFVKVAGQEVEFTEVSRGSDHSTFLVQPTSLNLKTPDVEIELVSLLHDGRLTLRPIRIEGVREVYSRFIIQPSTQWRLTTLECSGFELKKNAEDSVLECLQTSALASIDMILEKPEKKAFSNRLEIDLRGQKFLTRQLLEGLPSQAVIRLEKGWEVQSAIDVSQDDLPIEFTVVETVNGPMAVLDNENPSVWIIASKAIDTARNYEIGDMIPVTIREDSTRVELKNGLVSGFGSGIQLPDGVPSEAGGQPFPLFELRELEKAIFRFPADRQKFSGDFQYQILIDAGNARTKVDYQFSWDSLQNRTLVLELDLDSTTVVQPTKGQRVDARILTRLEKQRLGLVAGRRFWAFKAEAAGQKPARVVLSTTASFQADSRVLPVPRPLQTDSLPGEIRISGVQRNRLTLLGNEISEYPSQSDHRWFHHTGTSDLKLQLQSPQQKTSVDFRVVEQRFEIQPNGSSQSTLRLLAKDPGSLTLGFERPVSWMMATANGLPFTCEPVISEESRILAEEESRNRIVEQWLLQLPTTTSNQEVLLQISHPPRQRFRSSIYSVPSYFLNGQEIESKFQTILSDHQIALPFWQIVENNPHEAAQTIFWFPSLAFDSLTISDLFPWHQNSSWKQLGPGDEHRVLLVSKSHLTMAALLVFAMSAWLANHARRNRQPFYLALVCLLFSGILAGVYAMLLSFVFWGLTFGILTRELVRLCKFSPGTGASRLLTGWLLLSSSLICEPVSAGMIAVQENSQQPKSEALSVVIPVDEDESPTGIAYVPESIYEQFTRGSRKKQREVTCEQSGLEILSQSTASRLIAVLNLRLHVSETGNLSLPFFVGNAIFDSDSVTANNQQVTFSPDPQKKKINIRLEASGVQTVQIRFQVPLAGSLSRSPSSTVLMEFPFPGPVNFSNRANIDFRTVRENGRNDPPLSRQSERQLMIEGPFQLLPTEVQLPGITVVEHLDLSPGNTKRSITLLAESALLEDLEFETDPRLSAFQSPIISRKGSTWKVKTRSKSAVTFNLNSPLRPSGPLPLCNLSPVNFRISEQLVLLRVQTAPIFEGKQLEKNNPLIEETASRLAAKGYQLDPSEIDYMFPRELLTESPLLFEPESNNLSCIADYRFLVSRETLKTRAELDISSDRPFDTFELTIPPTATNLSVQLGQQNIHWIHSGENRFTVFANISQPGRFLFELSYEQPIQNDRFRCEVPKLNAVIVSSENRLYYDRQRVILDENLVRAVDPILEKDMVLAGRIEDLSRPVSTELKQPITSLRLEETIAFEQGKVRHDLVFQLPAGMSGRWLGIEIPPTASRPNTAEPRLPVIFESSKTLSVSQLWLPILKQDSHTIRLNYTDNLEGNRLRSPKLVNTLNPARKIVLPNFLAEDRIDWTLDGARSNDAQEELTVFDTERLSMEASFKIRGKSIRPIQTLFAEIRFSQASKKLSTRFFVAPNENRSFRLQVPAGHLLESVKVCGLTRQIASLPDGTIEVNFLNPRQLQIVDIVSYPSGADQTDSTIRLPEMAGSGNYQKFLYCPFTDIPQGLSKTQPDDIMNRRTEFLTEAVETLEVHRESAGTWDPVVRELIRCCAIREVNEQELKNRLTETKQDGPSVARIEPFTATDSAVYDLSENRFRVQPQKKPLNLVSRVRFTATLLALGLLGFFSDRLPQSYKGSFYSLLLTCAIWITGVLWVTTTPESIFAWCWILFAFAFASLFVIDSILKLRHFFAHRHELETTDAV